MLPFLKGSLRSQEAELDAPAEFFFDSESGQLFLFPNSTDGRVPKRLVATRLKVLISAQGTKAVPVRDVSISGIGIRDSATPMIDTRWGVPSGGDWGEKTKSFLFNFSIFLTNSKSRVFSALPHTGSLHFHGVENLTVSDCKFVRLDNTAVLLSGYARGVKLLRNYARWLGMGFAVAWGDTNGVDGTSNTQPQDTVVDSNFVSEIGITQKQSSFWFQAKSCLNSISNNILVNGPRCVNQPGGAACRPAIRIRVVLNHGAANAGQRST